MVSLVGQRTAITKNHRRRRHTFQERQVALDVINLAGEQGFSSKKSRHDNLTIARPSPLMARSFPPHATTGPLSDQPLRTS